MKLIKKFIAAALMLCLITGALAACGGGSDTVPQPESISITNTQTSFEPGEYELTAAILPTQAAQEYEFSLLLPVSGVTVKDNKLTITSNVDDGASITLKVKAKYSELITDKKTYTVANQVVVDWTDISNESELRAALLGDNKDLSKNYRLTSDIELREVWQGVGVAEKNATDPDTVAFVGRFNGDGHVISGFNLTHPDVAVEQANYGFFNQVGEQGIIERVGLIGEATGTKWGSALVGINRGTVRNCYADVDVTAITEPASGLVGANKVTGKISNSYAIGTVTCGTATKHGNAFVNAQDGTLEKSFGLKDAMPYSAAWNMQTSKSITKSKYDMLNSVIYQEWDETIWNIRDGAYPELKHSAYTPSVIVKQLVVDNSITVIDYNQGAGDTELQLKWSVFGLSAGAADTVTVTTETTPPTGITVSATGLIEVAAGVRDGATVSVVITSTVDATMTDSITVKVSNPRPAKTVRISTAAQLKEIFETTDVDMLQDTYLLENDIDCSTITLTGAFGSKVAPANTVFTGTFDGRGYALKNLKYSSTAANVGLFGTIAPTAIVKRLGVEIDNMRVGNLSGGIAYKNQGLIENCFVTGTIWTDKNFIGSFVSANEGTIKDCFSAAKTYMKCTAGTDGAFTKTSEATWKNITAVWDNGTQAAGAPVIKGTLTNVFLEDKDVAVDADYTAKLYANIKTGSTFEGSAIKSLADMKLAATYAEWDDAVWTFTAEQYPSLKKVTD